LSPRSSIRSHLLVYPAARWSVDAWQQSKGTDNWWRISDDIYWINASGRESV